MEGWGPVRYTSPTGASRLSNSGLNRDICTSRNGVTFITTKTSAIICHGNLCRGLDYVPVQALEPITPFGDTSSPSFVHHVPERHSLPRDIGVSAGEVKLELREWLVGPRRCTIPTLGCHCGSLSWFSGCLLQWLMSYFIFSLDYQERMEHGRGASQPLNLFLFLESADLFLAKSTFIWCA